MSQETCSTSSYGTSRIQPGAASCPRCHRRPGRGMRPRSRRSWPGFEFREADSEYPEPDRKLSSRTVRTPPALSAGISADAGSGRSSRSPLTRSDTASGGAVPEAARLHSTPRQTENAIPSNGASTGSSSGVAWPGHADRQTRPRLTGRPPPRGDPHIGPAVIRCGQRLKIRRALPDRNSSVASSSRPSSPRCSSAWPGVIMG